MRVVITGGTGSFGRALVSHLLAETDLPIYVYSRDEQKQDRMRNEIKDQRVRYVLGDVRDYRKLVRVLQKDDYVVHAAALKIIPNGEYNPDEIIKTNVNGTMNVLDAAMEKGVAKVICLSSDKAVHPVNLYGNTKACLEKLTILSNQYSGDTRMSVCRYGNVIGSRGSILTLLKQMSQEGKIRITDPRMTRFWITLPQAAKFVWDRMQDMEGGEIYVPKMYGCRVLDLCRHLYPDVPVEYIGLRNGEKIHEWLTGEYEDYYEVDFGWIVCPANWDYHQQPISSESFVMSVDRLLSQPGMKEEVERAAA